MNLEDLRYPIGRFSLPETISTGDLNTWKEVIRQLPQRLSELIEQLSDWQLDTPYRPDGWTVRQLVHHIADSHINSYIRFKWTMTENNPIIKVYNQTLWAELLDAKQCAPEISIRILEGIHHRWVVMLDAFTESDFKRMFKHPEYESPMNLGQLLSLYAWHSNHHIAHITGLIARMNW